MRAIPWLLAGPSIVLGHLFVLLMLLFRVAHKPYYSGPVLCARKRKGRFSTTVGAGVIFSPTAGRTTVEHEMIHVDQYIDLNWLGAILGGLLCIVSWKVGLAVYLSSGAPWLLPNYVTGFFRYFPQARGKFWKRVYYAGYYGSSHERWPYAEAQGLTVDEILSRKG